MKRDTITRVGLVILAVPALEIGLWAGFGPRSFYDDFPGLGAHWVAADGPFNEHLVRDVGWFNLALALVTLIAAWTLARAAVGAALGAWLVSGVPHLVYHLDHLDHYDDVDQIVMTASLAFAPIIATALLVLGRRGAAGAKMAASTTSPTSSGSST